MCPIAGLTIVCCKKLSGNPRYAPYPKYCFLLHKMCVLEPTGIRKLQYHEPLQFEGILIGNVRQYRRALQPRFVSVIKQGLNKVLNTYPYSE